MMITTQIEKQSLWAIALMNNKGMSERRRTNDTRENNRIHIGCSSIGIFLNRLSIPSQSRTVNISVSNGVFDLFVVSLYSLRYLLCCRTLVLFVEVYVCARACLYVLVLKSVFLFGDFGVWFYCRCCIAAMSVLVSCRDSVEPSDRYSTDLLFKTLFTLTAIVVRIFWLSSSRFFSRYLVYCWCI